MQNRRQNLENGSPRRWLPQWFPWIFWRALLVLIPYGVWESWTLWEPQMGDPHQCTAEDLTKGLQVYDEAVGEPDQIRQVARSLDDFVRWGCISLTDLEKRKTEIVEKHMAPASGVDFLHPGAWDKAFKAPSAVPTSEEQ
jgi:hypothetical protein